MQRENLPVHSSQLNCVRGPCPMREMQRMSIARQDEHAVWRASQNGFENPLTARVTALLHDVSACGLQMRANEAERTPQVWGATWETR